jgi:NADH:ubiquinone oxidoreductase subunit 6 (subunit J)
MACVRLREGGLVSLAWRGGAAAAVALSGVGINLARAIGPALGGLIVAAIRAPAVFWLNAASFVGVMLVLSR